jgi:hypothetical protein
LALTACRRATRATDAPASNVSSTIRRFSSTDLLCLFTRLATSTAICPEVSTYPSWILSDVSTPAASLITHTSSTRFRPDAYPYRGIGELSYPFHDRTALVTYCGRICIFKKKINLSTSLAGQAVGIKEVDDGIWLVTFMHYDLGYIDLEEKTLQPLNNPFGPKV